jgi:hypothetical protein
MSFGYYCVFLKGERGGGRGEGGISTIVFVKNDDDFPLMKMMIPGW